MREIYKAKKILKNQGLDELLNVGIPYLKNKADSSDIIPYNQPYYQRRDDNKYRWSLIQSYTNDAETAVDLGCAQGYFTNKLAEEGIFTLGIDTNEDRLSYAQNEWDWKSNIGFANWEITPDSVHKLPRTDILLFLTVYHHINKIYGKERAQNVLRILGEKSNILVCEMPGHKFSGLSFDYECTNIKNDNIDVITDYQNKDDMRAKHTGKIRPNFGYYLSPGEYEVTANANGYKKSSPLRISIGESGVVHGKPRVGIEGESITLRHKEKMGIDDVILWYESLFFNVFGDCIDILQKEVTERYKYQERNDIIYVIDTSEVSQ